MHGVKDVLKELYTCTVHVAHNESSLEVGGGLLEMLFLLL